MKNLKILSLFLLAFGLSFTACKKSSVDEPIIPDFSQTFKDVKLPTVTAVEPVKVVVVEAKIETSAASKALALALAAGNTTPEFTAAGDKIKTLATSTELDEINKAYKAGTQTAAQIAKVKDFIKSGAVNAFLPAVTLASVDGKAIGGRVSSSVPTKLLNLNEMLLGINDACQDKAKAAYDSTKKVITDGQAAQVAAFKTKYIADTTAAGIDNSNAIIAKYKALKDVAFQQVAANMDAIDAAASLSSQQKVILKATIATTFEAFIDELERMKSSDLAAEKLRKTTALANLKTAYEATLKALQDKVTEILNALAITNTKNANDCHNQGGSGI